MNVKTNINCPHCEYKFDDEDYERSNTDLWAVAPKEEWVEEKCPHCEKTIYIKGRYIPHYDCFKSEEDRECA